jgi:hypothetical protein
MNVSGVPVATLPVPSPSREAMTVIAATQPAVLQLAAVTITAAARGTSGQGTPAIDPSGGIDLYA